jgi:ABC-2 type transport system ATP-binding protein
MLVTGLDVTAVGDIAFQAGAPVHELAPVEASLEDVFMELTKDDFEFQAQGLGPRSGATSTGANLGAPA